MQTSNIKRTLAGLTLAAAVIGTVGFSGPGRAYADGFTIECANSPVCERAPGTLVNELPPAPFMDLSITLVGQNLNGSPKIQITNLGNEDSSKFEVVQLSAPGQREKVYQNLAAGQSVTYDDPSWPQDCGTQVEVVIAKESRTDSNQANNTLKFTPSCGPVATAGPN